MRIVSPQPVSHVFAVAIAWKRADSAAYRALVLWAKEDVANRIRPGMDAYGHLLRRPHLAARLELSRRRGDPVLFNDHLTSSLARLLRREHKTPVATREARVDSTSVNTKSRRLVITFRLWMRPPRTAPPRCA